MMVLQIVGVGAIATYCNRFDIVVVLVLLLHLVVAHQHLGKHTGRVFCGLVAGIAKQLYLVLLLLLGLQVDQEAQLVEHLVLIEVVELTRYLLTTTGDQRTAHLAITVERDNYRLIGSRKSRRVADAHAELQLSRGGG